MEEAAECRRRARESVRDIQPDALRDRMTTIIDDGSATPGTLTILVATAEGSPDPDAVGERAAGVQLIYLGLDLIRELAREEPWAGVGADVEGEPDLSDVDLTAENVAVIAADVLVSRGFYLLARTAAAGKAVETVRNFGRDQTLAREDDADVAELDASLEVDILQLAVIAGAAAAGTDPTEEQLSTAADIARAAGTPLPPPEHALSGSGLPGIVPGDAEAGDGAARTSATDP